MALTIEEVNKIAALAAIRVEEDEKGEYAERLNNVLDLFAQMAAVDTTGVEPMAHPLELTQRLREDEVTEHDQHKKFQGIAPKVEAGLYLVPQVIE
ncbi:aspartyl/glutamyl-tRNA(Asn/Gln) amidotransferase subunit C [Sulfurivirga caldicuralii]|uniref:Aspartyl/glutamyl-tRNA(Asn/Gln) amidotransferase subunit C n=1 Tax=Sulfurivirga caldicuralii TaxID=364032 RepID=A0A1N6EKL2_9GAMM|nr:Asp-tRNA(Asn)/Glu-tRNA(Gln) amidotransferase subunit GatC [Sulfurivirga caldicuralii]SIN83592.1 aspartyl/glutamyl-tRNA(Asn/Gln) amidotransferase subunit C [Sulfurivirga caldicuralii]